MQLLTTGEEVRILDDGEALAVLVTRPHFVSRDRLVHRNGARFELTLPLTSIIAVSSDRKSHGGATLQFHDEDDVPELAIVVGNQTNVSVRLAEPIRITLPNGKTGAAERVRADEPAAAAAGIRQACGAAAGAA